MPLISESKRHRSRLIRKTSSAGSVSGTLSEEELWDDSDEDGEHVSKRTRDTGIVESQGSLNSSYCQPRQGLVIEDDEDDDEDEEQDGDDEEGSDGSLELLVEDDRSHASDNEDEYEDEGEGCRYQPNGPTLFTAYPPPNPESHLWKIISLDDADTLRSVLAATIRFKRAKPGPTVTSTSAATTTTKATAAAIDILDMLYYGASVRAVACTSLLLGLDYRSESLASFAGTYRSIESIDITSGSGGVGSSSRAGSEENSEVAADVLLSIAESISLNPAAIVAMRKGRRFVGPPSREHDRSSSSSRSTAAALQDAPRQYSYTPLIPALTHADRIDVVLLYCKYVPDHVLSVLKSVAPGRRNSLLFEILLPPLYWGILSALNVLDTALLKREQGQRGGSKGKISSSLTPRVSCGSSAGSGTGADFSLTALKSLSLQRFLEKTVSFDGQNILCWVAVFDDDADADVRSTQLEAEEEAAQAQTSALTSQVALTVTETVTMTGISKKTDVAPTQASISTSMFVEMLFQLHPTLAQQKTARGLAATHYAALGTLDVLQALLRSGASSLVKDEQGWTPFLYALMAENVACALALLKDYNGNGAGAAVQQLRLLGTLINQTSNTDDGACSDRRREISEGDWQEKKVSDIHRGMDKRVSKMLISLGTVYEFRTLLNDVLRENISLLDEELGYLLTYPSLINLDNKMAISKKALQLLSHESNDQDGKYPIFGKDDDAGVAIGAAGVFLSREEPWQDLIDYSLGRRDEKGKLILTTGGQGSGSGGSRGWNSAHSSLSKASFFGHQRSSSPSIIGNNNTSSPSSNNKKHFFHEGSIAAKIRLNQTARLFKKSLIFQYKAEVGFGKGVERELLEAISKGMIMPHRETNSSPRQVAAYSNFNSSSYSPMSCAPHLFYQPEEGATTYFPLPLHVNQLSRYEAFYVCGRMIGHLMLRRMQNTLGSLGTALGINLPLCLWKLILNKTPSFDDVATVDEALHRSLQWMLVHRDEVTSLGLFFTASAAFHNHDDGANSSTSGPGGAREVDLKANGARTAVTKNNVSEYVALLTQHVTSGRMYQQAYAIRLGMLSILPSMVLSLFSEQELSILMTGSFAIDINNWKTHSTISAGSTLSHSADNVMKWFWKLVADLTDTERGLLLRFCTGCSRVPMGGFQQLKPQFNISIIPYCEDTSLPTAATCFNLLKLPKYPSERSLRKNVLIAITYGSEGFSFS